MTLVEICEPLFQYVCKINRMGRKGGRVEYGVVRGELKAIFQEMRAKAEATAGMTGPFNDIEMVLIFFTDSMILNSKLPPGWKPLSHERGELGFEEKFWDMLEDTLKDMSDSATQRLGVYYTCIGLGFTGLYTGQADYIRRKMLEISARMRGMIDADQSARICPEAYENVDKRDLTLPPIHGIASLVIAAVIMLVFLVVGYSQLFKSAGNAVGSSLDTIQSKLKQDLSPGS